MAIKQPNETMKIDTCIASLELDSKMRLSPSHLRGYIGYLFANIPEFHHHSNNSYHYPLVQYKTIYDKLSILGLQEYSEIVFDKVAEIDHVTTPDKKISITNLQLKKEIHRIELKPTIYRFDSPWIALNQKNYVKFKQLNKKHRRIFLEKILTANILSMLKGIGIRATFRIECSILNYKSKTMSVHENLFGGFLSNFVLNLNIPDHLGLGKSVSKGFGVISRVREIDN